MTLVLAISSKLQSSPDATANSRSIGIQSISTIGFAFMDATARTRALTGVVTDLQICRAVFTRILRGVTIAGHFVTGYRRRRALRATRVSARIAGATIVGRLLQPTDTRRVNSFVWPPTYESMRPKRKLPQLDDPPTSNSTLSTTTVARDPATERWSPCSSLLA